MSTYLLKAETSKKDKKTMLTLQGMLNISNINAIDAEFRKAIKDQQSVQIELKNVDDVDMTMMQYLKIFQLHAKKNNIECKIIYSFNEDNTQLLKKAGLLNLL